MNHLDALTNQRCSNHPQDGHAPDRHLRLGRQDCSLSATAFTSGSFLPFLCRNRISLLLGG